VKWNAFAEKFPLLEGEELEGLKTSIAKTKGVKEQPILYRMTKGKKEGLDGRNREFVCKELKIEPTYRLVNVKDEDVKDFILRRNLHRRHMTKELRRSIVAELSADGESTRQIAGAIGVSQSTVQSDLAASDSDSSAGERKNSPETVTGSDGKEYPAKRPQILCGRCTRFVNSGGAPQKNCPMCAEARKEAKGSGGHAKGATNGATNGASKKKTSSAKTSEPEVTDSFGNVVPKKCLDAYCDKWAIDTLMYLEGLSEEFRKHRIADNMRKRQKRLPHFKAKDVIEGVRFIIQYADQLIKHFKEQMPAGVCPACQGEGCMECLRSGLVPADLYKSLKKAAKETAKD
jgi:transposase-like protein